MFVYVCGGVWMWKFDYFFLHDVAFLTHMHSWQRCTITMCATYQNTLRMDIGSHSFLNWNKVYGKNNLPLPNVTDSIAVDSIIEHGGQNIPVHSTLWLKRPVSYPSYLRNFVDYYICDTIKENESHVGNMEFWLFNINHVFIKNATFWFKPHFNQTFSCDEIWLILWSS